MATVLITNNGPHSSDSWAIATAEQIFRIDPDIDGKRLIEARRLQNDIAACLVSFHQSIIDNERNHLSGNPEHLDTYQHAMDVAKNAARVIGALSSETDWNKQLNSVEWQRDATEVIASHMRTAQHIERQWHADNKAK